MDIAQWIIVFIIYRLIFIRASTLDALVLFVAYLFYQFIVIPLPAMDYYTSSSLLNLVVAYMLQSRNKPAAACSYAMILCNTVWFSFFGSYFLGLTWWSCYYDQTIYNKVAFLLLTLQLVAILPRGVLNGIRDTVKRIISDSHVIGGIKAAFVNRKILQSKKAFK